MNESSSGESLVCVQENYPPCFLEVFMNLQVNLPWKQSTNITSRVNLKIPIGGASKSSSAYGTQGRGVGRPLSKVPRLLRGNLAKLTTIQTWETLNRWENPIKNFRRQMSRLIKPGNIIDYRAMVIKHMCTALVGGLKKSTDWESNVKKQMPKFNSIW